MNFKQITTTSKLEGLVGEHTCHMFYKDGDEVPEVNTDGDMYTGCDYATVVICNSKAELNSLLERITEEMYQSLKDEFEYTSISVLEVNGLFLVNLDVEMFPNEDIAHDVMSSYVVVGACTDDISLFDLMPYRDAVLNGDFDDVSIDTLTDLYEDGEFDDIDDVEMSVDSYLRIAEYCSCDTTKINAILDLLKGNIAYED